MTPSLSIRRLQAQRSVDAAAGLARTKYITDVPGQQAVYLLKLQEAQAYVLAYASDNATPVPPHLAAEAQVTGHAAIDVAATVIELATLWNQQLSPAIEAARIGGKAAVAAATGADDQAAADAIEAARLAAVATLDAI